MWIDAFFEAVLDHFQPFEKNPTLAVAVSGGSDSLALTLLANKWVQKKYGQILALTVDHQLRPESSIEAKQIRDWILAHGIRHQIIVWDRDKRVLPVKLFQRAARSARLKLLCETCKGQNILHLLVGHTLEDQQETILMRSLKGSGHVGLAGMSSVIYHDFGRMLRPLLTVSRKTLQAYLHSVRQPWISDSSNSDDRFLRSKLRKSNLPRQQPEAILLRGNNRALKEKMTNKVISGNVDLSFYGFACFPRKWWKDVTISQKPILSNILKTVSGSHYPPRKKTILQAILHLNSQSFHPFTAGGCYLTQIRENFFVMRELRHQQKNQAFTHDDSLWDGRFLVTPSFAMSLTALGHKGLTSLTTKENQKSKVKDRDVPYLARVSLPVLRNEANGNFIAIPRIVSSSIEIPNLEILFAPRYALTVNLFVLV